MVTAMSEDPIARQIEKNRDLNLLFRDLHSVLEVDEAFARTLETWKDRGVAGEELEEKIRTAAGGTLEILYQVNQFIRIPPSGRRELEALYRQTWGEVGTEAIREVISRHFFRLSRWISGYYPPEFRRALESRPRIGRVVNREYTPELQLSVLGIRPEDLAEPILDLGCGPRGRLVRHLRGRGKQVLGVDRVAEAGSPDLLQEDWLSWPLEPETWGTVISHMGFSNHLIHVLHHRKEELLAYLERYREILHSLVSGGSFYYAPGLPWIEEHLDPREYEVLECRTDGGGEAVRIIRRSIRPGRE